MPNKYTCSFGIIPIENVQFLAERIFEVLGHELQDLGWTGGQAYDEKLKTHPHLIEGAVIWEGVWKEAWKDFYFDQAAGTLGYFLTEKPKILGEKQPPRTADEIIRTIKTEMESKVESFDAFPFEETKNWTKTVVEFLAERIHEALVHILKNQGWTHGSTYDENLKTHPDCDRWFLLANKNFYIDETAKILAFLLTKKP